MPFILIRKRLEEISHRSSLTLKWETLILVPLKQCLLIVGFEAILGLSGLCEMYMSANSSAFFRHKYQLNVFREDKERRRSSAEAAPKEAAMVQC